MNTEHCGLGREDGSALSSLTLPATYEQAANPVKAGIDGLIQFLYRYKYSSGMRFWCNLAFTLLEWCRLFLFCGSTGRVSLLVSSSQFTNREAPTVFADLRASVPMTMMTMLLSMTMTGRAEKLTNNMQSRIKRRFKRGI